MRVHRARACALVRLGDHDGALADCDEAVRYHARRSRGATWSAASCKSCARPGSAAVADLGPRNRAAAEPWLGPTAAGALRCSPADEPQRTLEDTRRAAALHPEWPDLFVAALARAGLPRADARGAGRPGLGPATRPGSHPRHQLARRRAAVPGRSKRAAWTTCDAPPSSKADRAPEYSLPLRAALTGDTSGLDGLPRLGRLAPRALPLLPRRDRRRSAGEVGGRGRDGAGCPGARRARARPPGDRRRATRRHRRRRPALRSLRLPPDAVVGETYWARGRLLPAG